ncbi:MAG: M20/M25/M40 family metallo-hydrolase, partial [Chloroflexota bacterium]|nr:M20/M25/M40 family metallo-hydrolase [Chloroflexota bacterium]
MSDHPIVREAQERHADTLELVRRIVELESPTDAKEAVDRLVDLLEQEVTNRGATVERLRQDEYGDLLVARFPGSTSDARPIHVMTHIDTVWPIGTIKRLPFAVSDDRATGPGIYDMKASAAMMLTALDILSALELPHRPIVWTINTEEEVGSPVSRRVLEAVARDSEVVLCLEPPVPPHGSLKTERKGVGIFTMEIEGRASHAGADHSAGVSAIEELARQVQWLHSLTNYDKGTTVNVGVVNGGTKRN